MLQQTQVGTVIPYYRRFLRAFPTPASLARARLERVLELWSGLGYYRRASNLHRAARVLVEKYRGRFPNGYRAARSLPGVGDYTAKAILSIAYHLPYSVLDGNVARVVSRLRARGGNLHQPRFRRAIQRDLDRLLSTRQPGDFNQAMMELGQTVCLPRAPRCPACPVRAWCRAYRMEKPESFPSPRPRRETEFRYLATALIRRNRKIAMVRGLDDGLLGELWNFPSAFGRTRAGALARLRSKLSSVLPGSFRFGKHLAGLRHSITYRSIRVDPYAVEYSFNHVPRALRWFRQDHLGRVAVSQLARKIAAGLTVKDAAANAV